MSVFVRKILVCIICLIGAGQLKAQSMWFGANASPSMNFQSWGNGGFGSGVNRDPLFSLNGDIFVESFDEDNNGTFYAKLGYHTRGSSFRFISFNNVFTEQQGFKFRNIVFEIGAKKAIPGLTKYNTYYLLGVRGEYTLNTNLDQYSSYGSLYYPINDFVRKFNYGVSAGGGFEYPISDLSNVFVEFSMHPDLSFQYEQQPLYNIVDPWTRQLVNLGLRQVRNLSLEFKVGIKFLRKVEYID